MLPDAHLNFVSVHLKDRSHLCFCLHVKIWPLYVETKEVTVKLLTIIEHSQEHNLEQSNKISMNILIN